jgi:hypothetical protein
MRYAPITFVGPLVWEHGAAGRNAPCTFYMLQSSGQSIKLEYANKAEAMAARKLLLKGVNAHHVASMRLLQAIQQALAVQQAAATEVPDAGEE